MGGCYGSQSSKQQGENYNKLIKSIKSHSYSGVLTHQGEIFNRNVSGI